MQPDEANNQADVSRSSEPQAFRIAANKSDSYSIGHRVAAVILGFLLLIVVFKIAQPDVAAAANEITIEFVTNAL